MPTQDPAQQPQAPPPQHPTQLPIDPTKNVLDLVAAEARYRDEMRKADTKYHGDILEREVRYQNAMREAETRRLNDLYLQKTAFDGLQAELLRRQVTDNALLLSAQINKVTDGQNERIAKLEQFRYESSGKGSGATTVVGYIIAAATLALAVIFGLIKIAPH